MPHGGHLLVDEGGEHTALEEGRVERPVVVGLVGEKGRLVEVLELFAVLDPLFVGLRRHHDECVVVGKMLDEIGAEDFANSDRESLVFTIGGKVPSVLL